MKGVDRIWSSCQPWYALSKIQSRTIATWSLTSIVLELGALATSAGEPWPPPTATPISQPRPLMTVLAADE